MVDFTKYTVICQYPDGGGYDVACYRNAERDEKSKDITIEFFI
jgi:hypothetical protein